MHRLLWAVVTALTFVACSGTGPHWVGTEIREVDGLIVDVIRRCSDARDPECQPALETALELRGAPTTVLAGAAIGRPPTAWSDGDGSHLTGVYAGLSQPRIVVLEFADGTADTVILACESETTDSSGFVVDPAACYETQFVWPARADDPPWDR